VFVTRSSRSKWLTAFTRFLHASYEEQCTLFPTLWGLDNGVDKVVQAASPLLALAPGEQRLDIHNIEAWRIF
jgi:hypothetical protein